MPNQMQDLPVYLFTGFLDAGKTRFIQETLEDERFHKGERTLLLMCEDGEEEYDPERFCAPNVFLRTVEDEADFTPENLQKMQREVLPERVIIEYNGMWLLDTLYQNLPEGWVVAQEFLFADAQTFLTYNANMRQLVVDKLKSAELVVLNRYNSDMDRMALHKVVRGVSRRADIAYEFADGNVEYDDIEDPLPFDIEAPIIEIDDRDYAIWYRDMSEEVQKYAGKTVRFKGRCLQRSNLPKHSFIIGRHVMTCCVEDIQFAGLVVNWDDAQTVQNDSWHTITAKLENKNHRAYGSKGPVLTLISLEPAEKPEETVATFY